MEKKKRSESGQSLVEFALVLPILLLLLGLIYDLGRAVHVKTNLQYIAGEAQKIQTFYEEGGARGGIPYHSPYGSADATISHIIEKNRNLDTSKIDLQIKRTPKQSRQFTRKHYDYQTGYYREVDNTNEVEFLTVTVSYEMTYDLFITRAILGDSIKMSESYTGTKSKNKQMGLQQTKKLLHNKGNHQQKEKATY